MKQIKKGKITVTITVGIACLALATVMFMQFKMVNQTDINELEVMREDELRTELANWKAKYEEAENQYQEKTKKLEDYNKTEASEEETEGLVKNELEQVNLILGKTDVEGHGITITLQENKDAEAGITSDNLNMIVNELKEAGAEAISINDERIINMTDIVSVNENTVTRVNQQRVVSPYVIKAIGNQTYLEGAISGNGGEGDKLEKLGHTVSITKSNKVQIKKYNKELTTNYIKEN